MGITNLHDYVARVEQEVRKSLRGARVIVLIETEVDEKPKRKYWERIYMVAWTRDDQSGTHRVHINSNDEAACFHGHYDLTETDAKHSALERANLTAGRM